MAIVFQHVRFLTSLPHRVKKNYSILSFFAREYIKAQFMHICKKLFLFMYAYHWGSFVGWKNIETELSLF